MALVLTAAGRVRGRRSGSALVFQGIPFASAPRFAPPGPVLPWTGERDATKPGPAAPQPRRAAAAFTHGEHPATAEECLSLNVHTPSLGGRLPVFVWLHGGGFTIGHAAASLYAGETLAAQAEAVVVTVNYRLGSLGWLGHPALARSPGEPAANWGLLDQIAALEWVREHAGAFGGDPAQVTLAGQSAGALSALDLLVAPRAAGLFRRAAIQSPPLADVALPARDGARWAQAMSAAAGGRGEIDVSLLRTLDPERIVALHEQLLGTPTFAGTRGGALPGIDAATLPWSPLERPGASPAVDVLIGHNAQEGTFFFGSPWRPAPAPDRIPEIVAHLCHTDDPQAVLDRHREAAAQAGEPDDPQSLLVAIATEALVAAPLAQWAAARVKAVAGGAAPAGAVHRYRVDHPGAGPQLRATHTTEVPLLFGTWRDGGPGERLGGQAPGAGAVSRELVAAWRGFIHGDGPGWRPLAADGGDPKLGVSRDCDIGVFGARRGAAMAR